MMIQYNYEDFRMHCICLDYTSSCQLIQEQIDIEIQLNLSSNKLILCNIMIYASRR